MASKKPSAVFFGTGDVAAESLKFMNKFFNIEAVITKAKPAKHKGPWPVEQVATNQSLKIIYADSKAMLEQKIATESFISKLGVVIDFGIIIPWSVINKFPLGIINSHFSLLPRWRGADPITYAVLNGDEETGVSLMKIVQKLDEGPILAQQKINLNKGTDARGLTKKLIALSNKLLLDYLPRYIEGKLPLSEQAKTGLSYSYKLHKSDGIIDWTKSADKIEREIRAYIIWPKSRSRFGSIDVIIKKAALSGHTGEPGELAITEGKLIVFCGDGSLEIKELQPAGKKAMAAEEFLRGYKARLGLG